MRRVIFTAAMVVLLGLLPVSAQQPIGVDANDLLAWDYLDADMLAYAVTHFERSTDAGQWTPATITEQSSDGAGVTTYASTIGQLTNGTHTIAVRTCNAVGCSVPTPFEFIYGNPPPPVGNPRIMRR